jgi:hypothetical protein
MRDDALSFTITPGSVLRFLLGVIVVLIALHLGSQTVKYQFGNDYQLGLNRWVDLDEEANLPTWYSALTLFTCALLLASLAWMAERLQAGHRTAWIGLSVLFLYLSLDEATSLHETVLAHVVSHYAGAAEKLLPQSSYVAPGWVIAGGILVAGIGVLYARFLLALPATTRWLFIASGVLFVLGGLGMEVIGATYDVDHGHADLRYALIVAFEEGGEMTGVALFLYALLGHMRHLLGRRALHLSIAAPNIRAAPIGAACGVETLRAAGRE